MKKINVAELLKDCPEGMELDCTMYENLYFDSLNADYYGTINCYTLIDGIKTSINLTKYGTFNNHPGAKCVIYPKGKTSWEGFVPPGQFTDGDVVCYSGCIAIFKEWGDETLFRTYVTAYLHGYSTIDVAIPVFGKSIRREARLATEEEKQKLFASIKAKGYKWNEETKTLEKLVEHRFKVGDRIRHKTHIRQGNEVTEIKDTHYILDGELALPFISQDDYELVPDKFDINTLVPFESKVLVRAESGNIWKPAIFGCYVENAYAPYFTVGGNCWSQCIPYEGNEYLRGKTDDCDKFYRIWEGD